MIKVKHYLQDEAVMLPERAQSQAQKCRPGEGSSNGVSGIDDEEDNAETSRYMGDPDSQHVPHDSLVQDDS